MRTNINSKEEIICLFCKNKVIVYKYKKREFCSRTCMYKLNGERISKTKAKNIANYPPLWKASSERMKRNNPMWMPGVKEKMIQALKGRTFLSRGGNSKITKPQQLLAEALNLPMEVTIRLIGEVRKHFPSLPKKYCVDIADVKNKLVIEVDGKSHKLKKWKFLDRRKEEILNFLGWRVIRFWNEDILEDLAKVKETVLGHLT
jgi:very-short-patch-repair endonuclease